MYGRTARMDGTGMALAGTDIADTGSIGISRRGADTAGTGSIGTGRRGAVIIDMEGGKTGMTRAVACLAVITAAGILPRRTCTLPMSICRASTCVS